MSPETAAQQREQALRDATLGLARLPSYELDPNGAAAGILYELRQKVAAIEAAETAGQQRPAAPEDEQIAGVMQEMARRGLGRL